MEDRTNQTFYSDSENASETASNLSDAETLSPLLSSTSLSSQIKEKKDLEIIKNIEEQADRIKESYDETVQLLRGLLGKSSATTVATIQTMRDATHDIGEISDSVVRESYTLMSQLEEINMRMISLHNSRKQINQISELLSVVENKLDL